MTNIKGPQLPFVAHIYWIEIGVGSLWTIFCLSTAIYFGLKSMPLSIVRGLVLTSPFFSAQDTADLISNINPGEVPGGFSVIGGRLATAFSVLSMFTWGASVVIGIMDFRKAGGLPTVSSTA